MAIETVRQAPERQIETPALDERQYDLDFLARYIKDEIERLEALAFAIEHALCPEDRDNLKESDNLHAWRLAEHLTERISDRTFIDYVTHKLTGKCA